MYLIKQLIEQKIIPENGWDREIIEYLLSYLSSVDSNNFTSKASVGEREGRCFSDLVAKRSYYFTHGIGRSGDLTELQPKATGSSILYKLTNELLNDLIISIYNIDCKCLLVPIPIGISLTLCLSTYRLLRKSSQYVIWLREDNEVIFKAIVNGGFTPVVVRPIYGVDILLQKIEEIKPIEINCMISTISCLYPRKPDNVDEIAYICGKYDIPHIILNDYGLQNRNIMNNIKKAQENGKVDLILQNAGENLMVPNGSTLVMSSDVNLIERVAKIYPGRASSNSVIDIFVTLLSLGKNGYIRLLDDRERNFQQLQRGLEKIAEKYKNYVNTISSNNLSIALTFSSNIKDLSAIDKNYYSQIKVNLVKYSEKKILNNIKFKGWNTHGINCLVPFITFQLSLGTSSEEICSLLEEIDMSISSLQIFK